MNQHWNVKEGGIVKGGYAPLNMDKMSAIRADILYVIIDRELLGGRDIVGFAEKLISSGIRIIQYRDKVSPLENSLKLKKLGIPVLIINDYPDIAREVDANGVHLGRQDMRIAQARAILGKDKIIGRSTHNLQQALEAQEQGADYIGIGPVFHTDTKKGLAPIGLDVVKEVVKKVTIPVVAIGGITEENLDAVLATGVKRVAVASAALKENFPWGRLLQKR